MKAKGDQNKQDWTQVVNVLYPKKYAWSVSTQVQSVIMEL